MAKGNGIEKKGHTKGTQLGIDGAKVPTTKGGKSTGGASNTDMKAVGRNLAKVRAQNGG